MRGNMFMPQNFGQLVNQHMRGLNQYQEDALRRKLIQSQIDAQNARVEQMRDPNRISGSLPSSMAGFERYQGYTPEQQKAFQDYLQTTKVNPYVAREGAIYNTNTGQFEASPSLGQALGIVRGEEIRTVAPIEAQAAASKAAATKTAGMAAEDRQKALQDLPTIEAQANEMLSVLDEIEKHPGLSAVVGAPEPMRGRVFGFDVPGSPAADFSTLYDRLEGQKFKQAYETLKGGGQITEIESKKATQAASTMSTAQSEAEFLKGLREYKNVISGALKRARLKAGSNPNSKQTPVNEGLAPVSDVIDYMEYFK